MRQAFQELQQALLKAPALALPNPSKPFQLFVDLKKKNKTGTKKGSLEAAMEALKATCSLPL